jgi:hypothetical protein
MPWPIVLATAVPKKKAAAKLKKAAQTTANFGDKTLVETTVAILKAVQKIEYKRNQDGHDQQNSI